jgi:hypothetical protein
MSVEQWNTFIRKTTVFWDVAPCSLIEVYRRFRGAYCLLMHRPDDGGSMHLWNVLQLLRDYTAQYPKRLRVIFNGIIVFTNSLERSPSWEAGRQWDELAKKLSVCNLPRSLITVVTKIRHWTLCCQMNPVHIITICFLRPILILIFHLLLVSEAVSSIQGFRQTFCINFLFPYACYMSIAPRDRHTDGMTKPVQ